MPSRKYIVYNDSINKKFDTYYEAKRYYDAQVKKGQVLRIKRIIYG